MAKASSRTFRSGNSQAVRLPRDVAYADETELTIEKVGDVITMYPSRPTLQKMVETLRSLPAPSSVEIRVPIAFPDRRGL